MENRALRIAAVQAKTGLTRTRVYELVESGDFPQPIKIGKRAVAWIEREVEAWLQTRVAERDKGRAA